MEIIAIANQKGGVGKTTTCVNLASALHLIAGKKVLLIDMDSQGNATTSVGLDKNTLTHTMCDVLLDGVALTEVIVKTSMGFDMIGANRDLAGIDVALSQVTDAPLLLKHAITQSQLDYDYVIIDCAPSLSLLTVNALVATDGVIIPMQCEYYALEGIADLTYTIEQLKQVNPKLHIRGVVRTLYDSRNMLSQDVTAELQSYFGEKLYQTYIPRNVRLAEAPSFGQSIFEYQKSSAGARAYHKFMLEVLKQSNQPSLLQ